MFHLYFQTYETNKDYSFIATQGEKKFWTHINRFNSKLSQNFLGPKEKTIEDFWKMLVQYSVSVVVMLTKCFEEGMVIVKTLI